LRNEFFCNKDRQTRKNNFDQVLLNVRCPESEFPHVKTMAPQGKAKKVFEEEPEEDDDEEEYEDEENMSEDGEDEVKIARVRSDTWCKMGASILQVLDGSLHVQTVHNHAHGKQQ
jgi:hypothetical protein